MHRIRHGLLRILIPSLVLLFVIVAGTRTPASILAENVLLQADGETSPTRAPSLFGSLQTSRSPWDVEAVNPINPFVIAGTAYAIPTAVPTPVPTAVPKIDIKTLQRNLDSQLSSRGGTGSVKAYADRAKLLIGLQVKLTALKKTPSAQGVDFTPYANRLSSLLSHIPTVHPIHGTYRGYGWRIHPITGIYEFHAADDIGAPTGTSVKAAAAGIVKFAGYDSSGGNMVVLDHGNGFKTVYMHFSKLRVKTGQKVGKWQVIGNVGSTGSSTTPHLHFAVSYQGTPFDPIRILQQW
jgi:murein DD-endopeptidase MepM/ murein hydrolase activator NlpD